MTNETTTLKSGGSKIDVSSRTGREPGSRTPSVRNGTSAEPSHIRGSIEVSKNKCGVSG